MGECYEERFGLIYVDYATQRRIPKDSLAWYAETVRSNGGSLQADTGGAGPKTVQNVTQDTV